MNRKTIIRTIYTMLPLLIITVCIGIYLVGMDMQNDQLQSQLKVCEYNKAVWLNQSYTCWDELDKCNQSYTLKSQELETIKHVVNNYCNCTCDDAAINDYLYGDDVL